MNMYTEMEPIEDSQEDNSSSCRSSCNLNDMKISPFAVVPIQETMDMESPESSGKSSRASSIYYHTHCANQKPLNVSEAHIIDTIDEELPDVDSKVISLPNHMFDDINELSVDIGGSLAKLVYFTENGKNTGVCMNFFKLETDKIDQFIAYMKTIIAQHYTKRITIIATGGGAHKYYDKLSLEFPNSKIQKEDEMQCLIIGLDFFITEIPREVFYFDEIDHKYVEVSEDQQTDELYPYLLVNIGSGVSMIKVIGPGPNNFERVGGSSLGGGTLWGLLSVLTNANSFDEMLQMASSGDNDNVDLLVGDIFGKGYDLIGLKSNHIASSMGKVFKTVFENKECDNRLDLFNQNDIARSMLYAISNNIGQIAYLQAQRYDLRKIYFAGSYIRNHYQTIRTLSYAINFWSKGEKRAYFLKHEGYLGSVGAVLMRRNE